MSGLRSYYDGDRDNNFSSPTTFQTESNKNQLFCSVCGETLYADDLVCGDVVRLIEKTSGNSFMCEECLNEYDDEAFQA